MNEHDIAEQAYKNGYEKGYEDGKRDAVPVVRCKDCKYYCNGWHCNLYLNVSHETKPDDFCSHGQRMDGDAR